MIYQNSDFSIRNKNIKIWHHKKIFKKNCNMQKYAKYAKMIYFKGGER